VYIDNACHNPDQQALKQNKGAPPHQVTIAEADITGTRIVISKTFICSLWGTMERKWLRFNWKLRGIL